MGGAYRWDKNLDRLVPITDWIPYEQSNLYGIYGLALHPTNEDIVYLSLGKYLDEVNDVFKSTDQGNTWEAMNFESAQFGGNHHPNRKGNTLMLNPHKPDELWAGTIGAGLHKFSNGTWHKLATIPGDGVIRSIAFDKKDGNYIYAAVTYQVRWGLIGNRETSGIYRSTDGGKSFELIPGFNREYDQFSDISLSKDGDKLFVSCHEHDNKTGAVFLLNDARKGSQWVNISPESGSFRTVTASPHDNNTVMTARGTFGSLAHFAVSTDVGFTWTFKSNFTVDNIVPWHPSTYPGSAISQIEFDPVNPKKVYFTDWYSVYYTEDWTLDPIHWNNNKARGHEQIVPAKIVAAHPDNEAGAILYLGGADISGITQTKLDNYSTIPNWATLAGSPRLKEVSGIDYCEIWVTNKVGLHHSSDGGVNWTRHPAFDIAKLMAVGKPQTPESYPALYVWGRKKGDEQISFCRSTDGGITFQKINLTTPVAGNHPMCMDADMSEFGKFYVGTRGRGVICFQPDETKRTQ